MQRSVSGGEFMKNVAEIGYNKQNNQFELVVPHGTKTADLQRIVESLQSKGFVGRLPRGCNTCLSGAQWNIRERLQEVIRVDLNTFQAIEE
jgi:hypothetical protein